MEIFCKISMLKYLLYIIADLVTHESNLKYFFKKKTSYKFICDFSKLSGELYLLGFHYNYGYIVF